MFSLLSLIACSEYFGSTYEGAPFAPQVGTDVPDAPTLSADVEQISTSPQVLNLYLPELTGRTVEIQAYSGGSPEDRAEPFVTEVVDATYAAYTLPTAPYAGEDEVVHTIALRETTEEGEPGTFLGLSDARLVWTAGEEEAGRWSLVLHHGQDDEAELVFEDGASVYENLQGPSSLSIAGENTVRIPGTHLAIAACDALGCAVAFDGPLGPDSFAADVGGSPPPTVLDELGELRGAVFSLETYLDEDQDNRRTTEIASGEACLGVEPVYATWFESAWDLTSALALQEAQYRSGWTLVLDVEEAHPLTAEEQAQLVLATTCG